MNLPQIEKETPSDEEERVLETLNQCVSPSVVRVDERNETAKINKIPIQCVSKESVDVVGAAILKKTTKEILPRNSHEAEEECVKARMKTMREPLDVEGGRVVPERAKPCSIVASATVEARQGAVDEIEEDLSDETLYRINKTMVNRDQLRFEDEVSWEGVGESCGDTGSVVLGCSIEAPNTEEGCDKNVIVKAEYIVKKKTSQKR
ncbi:hypothetical protein PIB30_079305 [Stylosanthes scabra]|uniref:Uncharacterized protein n=1 Tax=Stylosanthes scabra TaxID=79078 RepID=A0ABU6XP32_9FABA|nr:hypothetical protein [Stylosanthes scabra]